MNRGRPSFDPPPIQLSCYRNELTSKVSRQHHAILEESERTKSIITIAFRAKWQCIGRQYYFAENCWSFNFSVEKHNQCKNFSTYLYLNDERWDFDPDEIEDLNTFIGVDLPQEYHSPHSFFRNWIIHEAQAAFEEEQYTFHESQPTEQQNTIFSFMKSINQPASTQSLPHTDNVSLASNSKDTPHFLVD